MPETSMALSPAARAMSPLFLCLIATAGVAGCVHPDATAPDPISLADVQVSPSEAVVTVGSSLQILASALDAEGYRASDPDVRWSSSDVTVARVNGTGTVFGVTPGSVVITAAVGEQQASVAVRVSEAPDFAAVIRGVRPRGFSQGVYHLARPSQGGTMYWVSVDGSDDNPGSRMEPFRTIHHAAEVVKAGDVVTVRAGTFRESVLVSNSGTAARRIVFQAEQRGAVVLTGGRHTFGPAHWTGSMTPTGQFFVTVRGLIFREYGLPEDPQCTDCPYSPAVRAARGWRIEYCWFDRAGEPGLDIRGSFVEVLRSTFTDHFIQAFAAAGLSHGATLPTDPRFTPLEGLRIMDVVLRGNHTRTSQPGSPTASFVAKVLNTRGSVFDNLESSGNNGLGLWLDARNTDYVVRNSYFHDNRSQTGSTTDGGGRGLYLEINWPSGLVDNNVFAGNPGPAIDLANSSGITIRRNLFDGNDAAVRLTEWDRGYREDGTPVYPLQDIRVLDNRIRDWKHPDGAVYTYASKTGFRLPSSHEVLLDGNVYQGVRRSGPLAFWWNTAEGTRLGHMHTIEDMRRKAGWERNGRVGTFNDR